MKAQSQLVFSICLMRERYLLISVIFKRLLGKKEEIFMKMNVAYSIDFYSLAEKGKNTSHNLPNSINFIPMFHWLTTLLDEEFVFSFSIMQGYTRKTYKP